MKFIKEYITIIIIIVVILGVDFFTSRITEKTIENTENKINKIIEQIDDEDKEKLKDLAEEFGKQWEKDEKKLSYFAEHDELEKVTLDIVSMKAYLDRDERTDAYEEMMEIKFNIDHIRNKSKLRLRNLF